MRAQRGDASSLDSVTKRCVARIALIVAIAMIGYLTWDRASTPPQVDAEASQAYASFSKTDWESAFELRADRATHGLARVTSGTARPSRAE